VTRQEVRPKDTDCVDQRFCRCHFAALLDDLTMHSTDTISTPPTRATRVSAIAREAAALTPPAPIEFLRIRKVAARLGVGTSTLYAWIAKGTFPKPTKIGAKTIVWPVEQIDAWARAQIEQSQQPK
jgi:prophage regulatory protein